ncbi:hypothetical protein ACHAWU_009713 [Discostella pseudostelligera]|uniref:HMG box domain-containing protein n=1 Tax=Discostella pseudostelligera TaxID=259834 RepID=A0ABD3MP18_9STRA
MDYNNDDEWHLHRDALIGLLPSSNDADDDDANNVNAAHHHHCPEEILKIVDDNDTSFFDEEDVIGYYVSYNPYDDDMNMVNNDDIVQDDDEDEVVDTPATSDSTVVAVAVATPNFRTPTPSTTTATARRCHHHDSNTNSKSKRKRTRRDPNLPKGWLTPVLLYSNANRARVKMENPNVSFGDVARILSSEFKNLSSADAAIWQKASEEDKARHDREMAAHNSTAPPSAPLLPIPNHPPPPPPPPPVQVSGGDSTLINHQNDNNDDNDRTVPVQVSHDDLLTTSMVDEKEEVEAEEETVVAVMAPKAKRVKKPRKMKDPKDPTAPKRNRNAWNFYAKGPIRKQAHDDNPGAPLKVIMGILSRQFKNLTREERALYDEMVDMDKVRYKNEMERYRAVRCIGD